MSGALVALIGLWEAAPFCRFSETWPFRKEVTSKLFIMNSDRYSYIRWIWWYVNIYVYLYVDRFLYISTYLFTFIWNWLVCNYQFCCVISRVPIFTLIVQVFEACNSGPHVFLPGLWKIPSCKKILMIMRKIWLQDFHPPSLRATWALKKWWTIIVLWSSLGHFFGV